MVEECDERSGFFPSQDSWFKQAAFEAAAAAAGSTAYLRISKFTHSDTIKKVRWLQIHHAQFWNVDFSPGFVVLLSTDYTTKRMLDQHDEIGAEEDEVEIDDLIN